MNKCTQKTEMPEWMTKWKATLIQKDSLKGTASNNYRPLPCIPMMWKIITAQIRENIYYSLISCRIFPKNRKDAARGPEELLYINKHIL